MKKDNLAMVVYEEPERELVPMFKDQVPECFRLTQNALKQSWKKVKTATNLSQDIPMFYHHKIRGKKFDLF